MRGHVTCDTAMGQFQVAAEVKRTRLMLLVYQWRNSDVTTPASGASRVQQMNDVNGTSDNAVRRRHAATFTHASVLTGSDDDELVVTWTTQPHYFILTVCLHCSILCHRNNHSQSVTYARAASVFCLVSSQKWSLQVGSAAYTHSCHPGIYALGQLTRQAWALTRESGHASFRIVNREQWMLYGPVADLS